MSKSVRIVGAVFGSLIGIGLIVGGGVGLRGSEPATSTDTSLQTELNEAGIPVKTGSSVPILIRSTSGKVDTEAAPILDKVKSIPNVDTATLLPTNSGKSAALIMAQVAGDGSNYREVKAAVTDTVNSLTMQDGVTATVLGPSDPPAWRVPASWAAMGVGAVVVFAAGAVAFAGSRRSGGMPGGNPMGFAATPHPMYPPTHGPAPIPNSPAPQHFNGHLPRTTQVYDGHGTDGPTL
ncbi:hypothetical protein AB0N05_21860 [Nocardia sp. NPDC051030]|uniref:hypothetical protein n=1 Tax=Nocardia sp. NPDC051030 TaxID=3155162 RepID=UPI003437A3E3